MSNTPNYSWPLIATNQASPEITHNDAMVLIDAALGSLLVTAMTDADYTLNVSAVPSEASGLVFKFTGALTANRNIIVPDLKKLYVVWNNTTTPYVLTVKMATGTGIDIPYSAISAYSMVYCDGTNVVQVGITGAAGATGSQGDPGPTGPAGGSQLTQSDVTGSRAFGTSPSSGPIYQNTSGEPMFVSVFGNNGGGQQMVATCDASNPPTTNVAASQEVNGGTSANVDLFFAVPPGYFYTVWWTGGSSTLEGWFEYLGGGVAGQTGATGATGSSSGGVYPALTAPLSSNFTWENQGTSTVSDEPGRMVFSIQEINGLDARGMFQALPFAAPYTATLAVSVMGSSVNGALVYLALSDGSSWVCNTSVVAGGTAVRKDTWSSNGTSFGASTNSINTTAQSTLVWLRIVDDGVNRVFYTSSNGLDWMQNLSESDSAGITPTQIGFAFYNNGGGNGIALTASVYHWSIVNSALPAISTTGPGQ